MIGMRIAVDVMGGDNAPREILAGSYKFAKVNPDAKLLLFGEEKPVREELKKLKAKALPNIEFRYCGKSIPMDASPVEAMRRGQDSSVMCAINAVRDNEADAFVSAGSTGLCVAATTLRWRLLPGVKRAGIALTFPTPNGPSVALDLGANVSATAEHLLGYSVMGSVYCSSVFNVSRPSVTLINIGQEAGKGNKLIVETSKLLLNSNLNFSGYVEGNQIFDGASNVIVCDGFVGNLILKTAEGVAETFLSELKSKIKGSPTGLLGGILLRGAFLRLKKRFDYKNYGGAQLLGVNGVCIIAHGRSKALAIFNALRVAKQIVDSEVNRKIIAGIESELQVDHPK